MTKTERGQGEPQAPAILDFLGRLHVRMLRRIDEDTIHVAGSDPRNRILEHTQVSIREVHEAREWVREGRPIPEQLDPARVRSNIDHIVGRFPHTA